MAQTSFKKVPFNLELAKMITSKELKGRIVTEDGLTARIVCFDLKYGGRKILAALVDCGDYEIGVRCDLDGTCRESRKEDKFNLHIEVPTSYKDYSNFKPSKWQKCLVRDYEENSWGGAFICLSTWWRQCIPYEGNEHLFGTKNKPEQ